MIYHLTVLSTEYVVLYLASSQTLYVIVVLWCRSSACHRQPYISAKTMYQVQSLGDVMYRLDNSTGARPA